MKWARFECPAAGLYWVLACGAPPEAPGAVSSRSNDPPGTDTVAVSGARPPPRPNGGESSAPEPVDAGIPGAAGETPNPIPGDTPTERTFTACVRSSFLCDYIYLSMREAGTDLCVQLTLDNCGGYQRPGLPVDVPLSWQVASGSIGNSRAGCIPDVYDSTSVPVIDAGGTITWDDTARRPAGLVIDVTVEPSPSPGGGLDAGSISLSSRELVGALPDCED